MVVYAWLDSLLMLLKWEMDTGKYFFIMDPFFSKEQGIDTQSRAQQ